MKCVLQSSFTLWGKTFHRPCWEGSGPCDYVYCQEALPVSGPKSADTHLIQDRSLRLGIVLCTCIKLPKWYCVTDRILFLSLLRTLLEGHLNCFQHMLTTASDPVVFRPYTLPSPSLCDGHQGAANCPLPLPQARLQWVSLYPLFYRPGWQVFRLRT